MGKAAKDGAPALDRARLAASWRRKLRRAWSSDGAPPRRAHLGALTGARRLTTAAGFRVRTGTPPRRYGVLTCVQLKTAGVDGSTTSLIQSWKLVEPSTVMRVRFGTGNETGCMTPVLLAGLASGWSTSKRCESPLMRSTGFPYATVRDASCCTKAS